MAQKGGINPEDDPEIYDTLVIVKAGHVYIFIWDPKSRAELISELHNHIDDPESKLTAFDVMASIREILERELDN